jgi:hypothetical protein
MRRVPSRTCMPGGNDPKSKRCTSKGRACKKATLHVVRMVITAAMIATSVTSRAEDTQILDGKVKQSTVQDTICRSDYLTDVMPSFNILMQRKLELLEETGIDAKMGPRFALGSRVPVLLGGAPDAPANAELRPWGGPDGARRKRRLTVVLKRCVCEGKISLRQAQKIILGNWDTKYPHLWSRQCDSFTEPTDSRADM